MNKILSIFLRFVNLFSIILRSKKSETDADIGKGNEKTINPNNFKKELEKSIDPILKLIKDVILDKSGVWISGLLENELRGLEKRIEDLEGSKEKERSNVPDLIPSNEGLEEVIEKLRKIKDSGLRTISEDDLDKVKVAVEIALLSSQENVNLSSPFGEEDENKIIENIVYISRLKGSIDEMQKQLKIESLHRKGIALYKKKEYEEAGKCFAEITNINEDLKEGLLNRGAAFGMLGDIDKELECYERVLSLHPTYEKALRNQRMASKQKR